MIADPLAAVERFLSNLLESVVKDSATRQTLRIMTLKCEYVDELEPELARQTEHWRELEVKLRKVYGRARRARKLRAGLTPAMAALATCVFVAGLLRLWLLDERSALIRARARRIDRRARRRSPRSLKRADPVSDWRRWSAARYWLAVIPPST